MTVLYVPSSLVSGHESVLLAGGFHDAPHRDGTSRTPIRCRVNLEQMSQSWPNSGLRFQVQVLPFFFKLCPFFALQRNPALPHSGGTPTVSLVLNQCMQHRRAAVDGNGVLRSRSFWVATGKAVLPNFP